MKLVYIGANWPQPWITAAGLRTVELIKTFKSFELDLEFLSIKKPNPYQTQAIKALDVKFGYIALNNQKEFFKLVKDPQFCVFETSRLEEMFGHMIYNNFPKCQRILDTQDLHCLRLLRKKAVLEGKSMKEVLELQLDWKDELVCREFASILRSTSTILTSTHEENLIKSQFPYVNTVVLPFFYSNKQIDKHKALYVSANEKRKDFVWIGNFMHEPNLDSLDYTIREIWPKIHKVLGCEFHIYGAHCPKPEKYSAPGVVVMGPMKSIEGLSKYRGLLAYLRFGAGVKGKITDSFFYGLPVFTTKIGAEAIEPFPGFVADDPNEFIDLAIKKYKSDTIFQYQEQAFSLLHKKYSRDANENVLKEHLNQLQPHPIQNILFSETIRSSFYFSRFIEGKTQKELID